MNKKIKVIITILLTLILISVTNIVFAEGEEHPDVANGNTEGAKTSTSYSPVTSYPYMSGETLFTCGKRKGALKWAEGTTTWSYYENNDIVFRTKKDARENFIGVPPSGSSGSSSSGDASGYFIWYLKRDIRNYLNSLGTTKYNETVAYEVEGDEWGQGLPKNVPSQDEEIILKADTGGKNEYEYIKEQLLAEKFVEFVGKRFAGKVTYDTKWDVTHKNNRLAYILSSGKSMQTGLNERGKPTNYTQTISDLYANDINAKQYALWQDTKQNNPTASYVHNIGETPKEGDRRFDVAGLYTEAVEYENFYNNSIASGYTANFSNTGSSATVSVNRSATTYTVGPFVLNYADDSRFAYIEDMWLSAGSSVTYDITITGGGVSATQPYPSSGEQFYVTFNASSLGYPTNVQLHAKFKYLKETYAKGTRMEGNGPIYEYWSKVYMFATKADESEFKIDTSEQLSKEVWGGDVLRSTIPNDEYGKINLVRYEADMEDGELWYAICKEYGPVKTGGYCTVYKTKYYARVYKAKMYVEGGIRYNLDGDTYEAQPTPSYPSSQTSRCWDSITVSTPFTVDLRMKIGGKVFLDVESGKESKIDGVYSSDVDELIPNVEVVLYEIDRSNTITQKATQYTNVNGAYEFANLNALSKYYIRFKYNGQYYEPTYYKSPTVTDNYQNTSNGTDYQANYNNKYNLNQNFEGRTEFNEKFGTIYSYKSNYTGASGYNQTFTKDELLGYTFKVVKQSDGTYKKVKEKTREAVINEYGVLVDGIESSTNSTTKKMVKYVKDCLLYSWTKNATDTIDTYPVSNTFVINTDRRVYTNGQLDKSQFINQGYKERQKADVRIMNDVDNVQVEINGKTETFIYNARNKPETLAMDLEERISSGYYDAKYSREIYPSDYQFRVTDYGTDYVQYGKSKDDELKVYVTYKLTVINESNNIKTKINEIVDYYDTEFTYIPDRSYIMLSGNKKTIRMAETTRYSDRTGTEDVSIEGYNKLYVRGLDDVYLGVGENAYVYITFRVNKDPDDYIILDENPETGTTIDIGKENIAEIRGYSTVYETNVEIPNVGKTSANKIAGIVDTDSNPGNISKTGITKNFESNTNKNQLYKIYAKFEDDTDKAPNLKLTIRSQYNARIISGYVWEDDRNLVNASQATATGNGIRDAGETLINGVIVQLVEVMDNGTEYIWREFGSNIKGTGSVGKGTGSGQQQEETPIINIYNQVQNYQFGENKAGAYAFKSFVPGNYIVRFIYGKDERTVLTTSSDVTTVLGKSGLNAKSYNGQDYKSTTYQVGLGTYNGKNLTKQYTYDIVKGDSAIVSDAKDLYNIRQNVNNYSTKEVRNSFAEELNSYMSVPEYNGTKYSKDKMTSLLNSFMNNTKMTAETGIIDMQVEYNRAETQNQTMNNVNPYHLANLDLGLEERPKAQIEILKEISNIKITLANGNVLFDATQRQENLAWIKPHEYAIGQKYNNYLMSPDKYGDLDNIMNIRFYELIQPTIDKELMHGATLRITYKISAINIGEVDYNEEKFYYTGNVENKNTLVTSKPIQLVDYIPNNLKYYEMDNNTIWQVVKTEDLTNGENNLVNINLKDNLDKFNTIITTKKIESTLVPEIYAQKVDTSKTYQVSVPLVLTQVLSAENKDDDLDYINKVELVAESNSNGRKMAYSVVGNQDPTGEIKELDASKAETRILPPFGAILTYIIISVITIAGAAIIVFGIIFIKKKVLTK